MSPRMHIRRGRIPALALVVAALPAAVGLGGCASTPDPAGVPSWPPPSSPPLLPRSCAEADTVSAGTVHDADRVSYLHDHLHALRATIDAGVDFRGYYVWSLLDNFEWALGYSQRFGIVRADYDTQQRIPKDSYRWYRDVMPLTAGPPLHRQYMLGDDLLVAPVFSEDGTVEYYVPEGTWTHVLTGERVSGPRWRRETHGFDTLPLLARPGSVVPFGASEEAPEYDWVEGVTLHVHAPADGGETVTTVPTADGGAAAVFRTRRTDDVVTVETRSEQAWQVLLVGAEDTEGVKGADSVARTPLGVLIGAAAGTSVVTARWS